jgi:hypothetical protein
MGMEELGMHHNWWAKASKSALAWIALFALAACGGSTPEPGPGPRPGDDPTFLTGSVTIAGDELADLDDQATVGSQDADKWGVRVIDPTESVDDIELPHGDTLITTTEISALEAVLVSVNFIAAVDLNGHNAPTTPLALDCAIPITAEAVNTFHAQIDWYLANTPSSVHGTSAGDGYLVRLNYQLQGTPDSATLLELDWDDKLVRRDTNGNGHLDDETFFNDKDRDGISNNRDKKLKDIPGHGVNAEETGTISAVDVAAGEITLPGRTYLIDETTVVLDANGATITLSDFSAGQVAYVKAERGHAGVFYASRIELQP